MSPNYYVFEVKSITPAATPNFGQAKARIKQQLENAKGVGEITILGGAKREIHIMVDPDRLRAYNLTITDVFNALHAQFLAAPVGA